MSKDNIQNELVSDTHPGETSIARLPKWGSVPTGYRLPSPLTPFAGESLPGLIMRNAGKYQLQDPRLLLTRLSPPPIGLHTLCRVEADAPAGEAIRELLGVDPAAWNALAMGAGSSNLVRLNGHLVPRDLARLEQRHVCPQCLSAMPFHRTFWFFDAVPVCVEHCTKLLADCPRCERPLGWRGAGVHLCGNSSCGFDLRRAVAERVPEEELAGAQALMSIFEGSQVPGFEQHSLPVGAALRLMLLFGQIAEGLSISGGVDALISREQERIHKIVNRGWQALENWPEGFHHLLDGQVALAASRPGKTGLRKLFGYLSSRIYAWQREPWGRPIAEAFALYISSRPDMPITARVLSRFGSTEALKTRNLTLNDAARMLHVSGQTMVILAERHNLFLVAAVGSGLPSLLSVEKVVALQEALRDALLFEEGRQILGVGRPVVEQIEASGLIRRVVEDRVVDSQIFRRIEIEAFLAACRGAATPMTQKQAQHAGLASIVGMVGNGRSYADICRALIDGTLVAQGLVPDVPGLGAIRLRPADVKTALPHPDGLMSAVEVGKHLRIAHRLIRHWTARGFLVSSASKGTGETGLRYRQEDIDRFLEKFMPGGEVAEKAGTPGCGTFARHLRFLGIQPVSGPVIDGSDGTLYCRADITAEVLQTIDQHRDKNLTVGEQRARASAQIQATLDRLRANVGPTFKRIYNRLEDPATGQIVQLISGQRMGVSGAYRFRLNPEALERLLAAKTAHVALVPDKSDLFIYAPLSEVLAFAPPSRATVGIRFDPQGNPQDLAEYVIPLGAGKTP